MSTQSVKTNAWNDIELARHIRPYRLAVIELIFTATGQPPTFRTVFTEFGNNIVNSTSRANNGDYSLNIASSIFSKVQNVATASSITYNLTTVAAAYTDMYVTSYFNTTNYNTIRIVTSNLSNVNTDFIGKIFINIKEYYE